MIIDDNEMDLLFLKETLKTMCFSREITTFENPFNALNLLKQSTLTMPDLVFVDVNMPGINGFQFIARFKQSFSGNTKFILVSASDDAANIHTATQSEDIINYFIKPVSKIDLIFAQNRID
jgi:two-component SAPR family response regulator